MSDSENDSEPTYSSTSSEDEGDDDATYDTQQIKLMQMKRNAKNKGTTSKLLQKYKNIMTPEERARSEMLKRIDAGIRSILMLHTPVELSSMCGVLGLKPLERASNSIDQLILFCKEGEDFMENKIVQLVNVMWESAIFEYLKSIGHPMASCYSDPKLVLMKVWKRGGFGEVKLATFTPHFVCKRILTRFDADSENDVSSRLSKLKVMEINLKKIERHVYEEHDFTNVISFLQQLHTLRQFETECRDYFVEQLENSRAELSRARTNTELAHEMQKDCEERYMKATDVINERTALVESSLEEEISHRLKMTNTLKRLELVTSTLLEEKLSGEDCRIRELSKIEQCHPHIRSIDRNIRAYREKVKEDEQSLRDKIAALEAELRDRDNTIVELQAIVEEKVTEAEKATQRFESAKAEIKYCAAKLVSMKLENEAVRNISWIQNIRVSSAKDVTERNIDQLRGIVLRAAETPNKHLQQVAKGINRLFKFVSEETLQEVTARVYMEIEDIRSRNVVVEDVRTTVIAAVTKVKKKLIKTSSKKAVKKSESKDNLKSPPKTPAKGSKPSTAQSTKSMKSAGKDDASKASKSSKASPKKASGKKK